MNEWVNDGTWMNGVFFSLLLFFFFLLNPWRCSRHREQEPPFWTPPSFFSFFSFSFLPLDLSEVFGGISFFFFLLFFFLSFSRNGFGGLVGIRKDGKGRKELTPFGRVWYRWRWCYGTYGTVPVPCLIGGGGISAYDTVQYFTGKQARGIM